MAHHDELVQRAEHMTRLLLALATIAALGLASCGVRGPLEAPPGAQPPANEPTILDPLID